METTQTKLTLVRVLMIVAALVTAAVHVVLALGMLNDILAYLFFLNALGFIGLTAMYLRPLAFFKPYHEALRWGLVGFSAVTILLWVIMNGNPDPGGVTAKLAEIALIVLLLIDRGKR
jgi:hypothetical protein